MGQPLSIQTSNYRVSKYARIQSRSPGDKSWDIYARTVPLAPRHGWSIYASAEMTDSPGSPLSILSSVGFEDEDEATTSLPPAKRQRMDELSMHGSPALDPIDNYSISSDSSGEVPNSPGNSRPEEEDGGHEQVTLCAWEGCDEGDCGDMDRLVDHIHTVHIESRQKTYTCEWSDCSRKGMPHASGYALKAHMRSHTREKPFYCALPECDRSFTRSDALAKHMRTVHETEALRPSDPVPKSMQPAKGARIKLILKQQNPNDPQSSQSPSLGPQPDLFTSEDASTYTKLSQSLFTEAEMASDPKELYRLLRRQVHWAEEENDELRRTCETVEAIRKNEWMDKEILLEQVLQSERDYQERKMAVLLQMDREEYERQREQAAVRTVEAAQPPSVEPTPLPTINSQEEAAAVLASLHQG